MRYGHDIMHCRFDECKRRHTCYRYNAHRELMQHLAETGEDTLVSMLSVYNENCKYYSKDDTEDSYKE